MYVCVCEGEEEGEGEEREGRGVVLGGSVWCVWCVVCSNFKWVNSQGFLW